MEKITNTPLKIQTSVVDILLYIIYYHIPYFCTRRLRKVKMDQRKLMDNANTITDMAKVSNKQIYRHLNSKYGG